VLFFDLKTKNKNKNGSEKRKGPSFGQIGFVFLIIKIRTTGNRGRCLYSYSFLRPVG